MSSVWLSKGAIRKPRCIFNGAIYFEVPFMALGGIRVYFFGRRRCLCLAHETNRVTVVQKNSSSDFRFLISDYFA